MERVSRYKCDFCQKMAVKQETIERHEKVCVHNPEGKNCYMCECSYLADYEEDDYHTLKDQCLCAYNDDVISATHRKGNMAPECCMFHRSDTIYWERDYEQASANVNKYMVGSK